ncbi:DotD/TraH family lipoprotein [Candidatus Methylospira mobilis]|uniref:DotD/TraH family lipoprotein n=1 Tax=Candidatus Methylospira mobilis TaxID=1808979 RepID=UPI0028EBD140|nr:DotD/TraH family lipoprotein [Candidatus Methylospira mobilis]WNV05857.1 DotD/TraH family lipoprotein [Candidatus Methylospira mobilis]
MRLNIKRSMCWLLVASLCELTACATDTRYTAPSTLDIDARVVQSANQIHSDMATLSSLLKPRVASLPHYKAPAKGPLATPLDISWSGDAEHVLKHIGEQIGFRVNVGGLRPADTLFVTVESHAVSAFRILEDIGVQLGTAANIDINEKQKLIALDYLRAATANVEIGTEQRQYSEVFKPSDQKRHKKKKRTTPQTIPRPVSGANKVIAAPPSPVPQPNDQQKTEKRSGHDVDSAFQLSDSAG